VDSLSHPGPGPEQRDRGDGGATSTIQPASLSLPFPGPDYHFDSPWLDPAAVPTGGSARKAGMTDRPDSSRSANFVALCFVFYYSGTLFFSASLRLS